MLGLGGIQMLCNVGKIELDMAVVEEIGSVVVVVSLVGYSLVKGTSGLDKTAAAAAAAAMGWRLEIGAHLVEHALCRAQGYAERVTRPVVEVLCICHNVLDTPGRVWRRTRRGHGAEPRCRW